VRGITLDSDNDEVVGMICVDNPEHNILVVSENGYGKQTALEDYRITNRGGKGVKTIKITPKTGPLVGIVERIPGDDLMIITRRGTLIRMDTESLRVMGRATQGVRLINLRDDDAIAAIARVPSELKENEQNGIASEEKGEIDTSSEISQ
jgi:DNA gyrase subunit A